MDIAKFDKNYWNTTIDVFDTNEFSFRTDEEKRGKIVVYLELFMCTEHTGEFSKSHYEVLSELIENYESNDYVYFNNDENNEIKSMLEKYGNRVKEMNITEVTGDGEYLIYRIGENNKLELKSSRKLRVEEYR